MQKLSGISLFCFSVFSLSFWAKPLMAEYQYNYNKIANECCFLDWGHSGWFTPGAKFPDASLYSLERKKYIRIQDLVKDRPIVLELGSITCPAYDLNLKKIKELKEKYKGQIDFYTVYVRENHPSSLFKPHTEFSQKVSYAEQMKKEDEVNHDILIDDIEGTFHQQLGKFGNSIYLVGKDMKLAHWSMFAEPNLLEKGIESLFKSKGIGGKAAFVGGTDVHPIAFGQYTDDEKRSTILKMKNRTAKEDRLEAAAEIQSLQGIPAYLNFNEQTKESLHQYLRTAKDSSKLPNEKGEAMLGFQIHLRGVYKQRFERWKSEMKIRDHAGFSSQIPSP